MLDSAVIEGFVAENISGFHQSRLDALGRVRLDSILKRKNPYLFKAKNIQTASELVISLLQAHLSSQEETIFGEFLEKMAIFACRETKGGYKSGIEGIDLEFEEKGIRYVVTIKSGPNWGNSSQIAKMKQDFVRVKRTIRTQNQNQHVVAINGCCYGKDRNPDKGEYIKYCGQAFWYFITGDSDFYIRIVEPLGYKAKEKNDAFNAEYDKLTNRITREFLENFCLPDGSIDWPRIIQFNSKSTT